jgi:dTMP kinase
VGIDGSGKTTLGKELARWLAAQGVPAEYSENPGGRVAIDRIARRLGRRDGIDLLGRYPFLAVETAVRWLAIARGLLLARWRGRVAVMDRYSYCQLVVMRARGDRGESLVRCLYSVFPRPDLVIFLRVPPETAKKRIDARGYDREPVDYLSALDRAYRTLPEFPTFREVDGDAPVDVVAARAHDVVAQTLGWVNAS